MTVREQPGRQIEPGDHLKLLKARHPDEEVHLRTRAIYILQRFTGLRISSVLALRIDQVWHDGAVRNSIHVERTQIKRKRGALNLSLLDEHGLTKEALRRYLRFRERFAGALDPASPLFVSRQGTVLSRFAAMQAFKKLCALAGVDYGRGGGVTTHSARHKYLSDLSKKDPDLAFIASGHANRSTFAQTYLHRDLNDLHDLNMSIGR